MPDSRNGQPRTRRRRRVSLIVALATVASVGAPGEVTAGRAATRTATAAYAGLGTGRGWCGHAESGGYPLSGGFGPFRGGPSYDNVWACGPLPIDSGDYGPSIPTFWPTGAYVQGGGFQCTEFAERYLHAVTHGDLVPFGFLMGKAFARLAARYFHFALRSSLSGRLPRAGDIISEAVDQADAGKHTQSDPGVSVGDVAVVARVDGRTGRIWVVAENNTGSGYNVITMRSRRDWVINPGSQYEYSYFEWIDPNEKLKHQASPGLPPKTGPTKGFAPPSLPLKHAIPSSKAPTWNLATDVLAHPDLNPAPDHFGHSGVWSFMASATLARNGGYSPLANHVSNFEASVGTVGWTGTQPNGCGSYTLNLPLVAINTTAQPTTGCGTWTVPPYEVDLHPAATQMAVVAWKSPIAGTVTINGRVASLDPFGGGGISYYVTAAGSTLISGAIPDGGKAQFPPTELRVSPGQILYVMIAPPASGLRNNSTSLELTITLGSSAWPTPTRYQVIGRPAGHPLAVRTGPSTRYGSVVGLTDGSEVGILCQAKGTLIAGRSDIWDQIAAGRWVSDYYLDTPGVGTFSPGLTTCPG